MGNWRRTVFLVVVAVVSALSDFPGIGRTAWAEEGLLILATTTSTENTGLLAAIHPDFEAKTGLKIKVVAKGTGASLQLARDGNADVVLVHARQQEDAFVDAGFGVMRRDVMYNDFVLVGPPGDPAGIKGAKSAAEACKRIAAAGKPFVSRGDDSGTHVKEQEAWQAAGIRLQKQTRRLVVEGKTIESAMVRPEGDWYLSIGQGMGKTLTLASEKLAYTLTDRGTYYAMALSKPPKIDLAILCEGDPLLFNPYGVIAVNPKKHAHVNFVAAQKYVQWITSPEVQKQIGDFKVEGKTLFFPGTGPQAK